MVDIMTNAIACTSLIKTEQIKNVVQILYWKYNYETDRCGNVIRYYFQCPHKILRKKKSYNAPERTISSFNYYLYQQNQKTNKNNLTFDDINLLFNLSSYVKIPERYIPKVIPFMGHCVPTYSHKGDVSFMALEIQVPLISYLEQKPWKDIAIQSFGKATKEIMFNEFIIEENQNKLNKLVSFLKDLNSQTEGIEFDVYIDKWTKELLTNSEIPNLKKKNKVFSRRSRWLN